MPDLSQIRHLITNVSSGDAATKGEAARALKGFEVSDWDGAPVKTAIKPLVDALRHQLPRRGGEEGGSRPSPLFRQDVAVVLGKIGSRAAAAVPQLIDLLKDNEAHGVREAAVTALGKIGPDASAAVESLIGLLGPECKLPLAVRVARSLGEIGRSDAAVRGALVKLWNACVTCPNQRAQIAVALCQLRCDAPGMMSSLTATAVSSPTAALRVAAVEAVGWCSKNEIGVVPALTAALHDDDENVNALATAGLERLGVSEADAIKVCAKQLNDSPLAETALRRTGAPAIPVLIRALDDARPMVRERAAKTLGAIGEPAAESASALEKVLRDRCSEVRLAAAKALWNVSHQPEAVVPALAELLTGKISPAPRDAEARRQFLQSVIEALGRIGPPARAAVRPLMTKARDDNRLIRESAQRSLRQIDPAAGVKVGV